MFSYFFGLQIYSFLAALKNIFSTFFQKNIVLAVICFQKALFLHS